MISDTLTALSGDIQNAYIAIGNKGGTYTTTGSKDLSTAIDTIPQGSSSTVIPYMIERLGMPDIREILANEPRVASYKHKVIVLFWDNPTLNVHIRGANYYIGSDGYERTSDTKAYVETHTFTPIEGTHYFWIIYASNLDEPFEIKFKHDAHNQNDYIWSSNTQSSPLWVYGPDELFDPDEYGYWARPVIDMDFTYRFKFSQVISRVQSSFASKLPKCEMSAFTGTHGVNYGNNVCYASTGGNPSGRWVNGAFYNWYCLIESPEMLDMRNYTTLANMFGNCVSMRKGPKQLLTNGNITSMSQVFYCCNAMDEMEATWETSATTNFMQAFHSCQCLDIDLDWIDTRNATNTSYMFSNCYSLKKPPSNMDLKKVTTTQNMFANCCSMEFEQESYDLSSCTNASSMFYYCKGTQKFPNLLNTSKITTMSQMFYYCSSMRKPPIIPDTSKVTSMANMFGYCYSLEYAPEMDMSKVTNVQSMFANCYTLRFVPDTMNLSSVTSNSNMMNIFASCPRVMAFPTHLTMPNVAGVNLSFSTFTYAHPNTLATFDENGNINGGMVYNLNSVTNAVTITLNSTVAGRFTPEHRTAITTMLQNKGYTVASFTSSSTDGRF